jgi:23S rRNA (uracil1939-C5)-methyltransferase
MKANIIKFDHFGRGISRINDKIIFIDKALPEEIVEVKVTNDKKNYLEGKVENIVKENKDRIKPICPFYDKCGGCNFLHTTYNLEKKFKLEKGNELLGKIDNFYETKDLNYRNKVTLHVKNNKLGFYEEKSNKLIEIDYCYLLNDMINKVIKDLKKVNLNNIKEIVIKCNQDKLLLDITGNISNDFINNFNYIDTIICNKKIIKGNGFIEEVIDGKTFKITREAFFQVNKEGLENINKIIQDFLNNKKINNVLDLYSGTSLWGILVSNKVNNVTSIEINREACLSAKDNIKKNNIKNIKVINGDVAKYIDKFKDIDLVIIDPPRSGLDKKTREYLKIINSKYIIYISCDMKTLQRDLNELKEVYNVTSINLVDMFKRTYHIESVIVLERKIKNGL